ncbi:hypothetical protein GF327_03360 [Candidatus Woesearchaeota archaeon]|nr:hypothetical protein [Candidatus Woesearchaeota archaeon]
MGKKKRGQYVVPGQASQAALLVLVIGVAILLYILMLPPKNRAELLGENITGGTDGPGGIIRDNITILLKKQPGTLNYLAKDEIEFSIPSFNLFTRTDAVVLVNFDSVYIRKSLFNYEYRNISFSIKEMEKMENFVLSFNTPTRSGVLKVLLNGNIILNKKITNENPDPIILPRDYLKKQNVLEFEVSGPGMNFWEANEYTLENLKITADITDFSGQENRQSFLVSEQEKSLLEERAGMSFTAECNLHEVGPLHIYLNNMEIFSGIPDCGYTTKIPPISRDKILAGENTLRFSTEKGRYLLYSINLQIELEEPVYPTYYFTLNSEMFESLKEDTGDLNVTVVFSNQDEYKKGVILLNGFKKEIDTKKIQYSRKLNDFARLDNNAVEIKPVSKKLEIVELKVIYAN